MNTNMSKPEKMQYAIERLGEAIYTEQDVIDQFAGKSVEEIADTLNGISYDERNSFTAEMIFDAVK